MSRINAAVEIRKNDVVNFAGGLKAVLYILAACAHLFRNTDRQCRWFSYSDFLPFLCSPASLKSRILAIMRLFIHQKYIPHPMLYLLLTVVFYRVLPTYKLFLCPPDRLVPWLFDYQLYPLQAFRESSLY